MLHEPVKALKPLPMLELPKIPGKGREQTLQEWHAAGGSIPVQYKSKPHVWHAKVKRYADGGSVGGEAYGNAPDSSDGGAVQDAQHFQAGGIAKLLLLKAAKPMVKAVSEILPAAEREANLAKLLEPSQVKERLYHGTTDNVNVFDPKQAGKKTGNVNAGLGSFLSNDRAEANRYATQWGTKGGNVMPVYAQIKNPYEMPYEEFNNLAMGSWNRRMKDPDYAPNSVLKFNDLEGQKAAAANLRKHDEAAKLDTLNRRQELMDLGYDGVVVKIGGNKEYVAFEPNQIKSAIGNRGTYDVKDPDINKKAGGAIHMADGGVVRLAGGGDPRGEIRPTPRNKALGMAADAAKGLHSFASEPFGYGNPPGEMLSEMLGVNALGKVLDKLSYGEPITNYGKANVPFLPEDTGDLAMALGPLAPAGARLAAKGAKAAGRGALTVAKKAIENANVPVDPLFRGAAGRQRGVVKLPNGDWLSGPGSPEQALSSLKTRTIAGETPAQRIPKHEELLKDPSLNQDQLDRVKYQLGETKKEAAIDNWVDRNLTNYVKKQMGTSEDPVRKLAEQGITHMPQDAIGRGQWLSEGLESLRKSQGFPGGGMGGSETARGWENLADEAIQVTAPIVQTKESLKANPWLSKLPPNQSVYNARKADIGELNFDHIIDVLKEDLAAGRIRPEQLNKVSMEQAVRRTYEYDQEMARKMREAQAKVTEGMPVHKEYPEGYKWIELAQPKGEEALSDTSKKMLEYNRARGVDNPESLQKAIQQGGYEKLEQALKYEGDTMGHCVGGYCPEVAQGRSRIYSLRDAKGEPHVTVEVEPDIRPRESYYGEPADKIVQIKGKQNRAPKEEYLPYVQDFVKSGNWSGVGDPQNAGLRRYSDVFNINEQRAIEATGQTVPSHEYLTGEDIQRLHNAIVPEGKRLKYDAKGSIIASEPGYKAGGEVHMQAGGLLKFGKLISKEAPVQAKTIREALGQAFTKNLEHSVVGSADRGYAGSIVSGDWDSVRPNQLDILRAVKSNRPIVDFHTHPQSGQAAFDVAPSGGDFHFASNEYFPGKENRELRTLIASPANAVDRVPSSYSFFATDNPSKVFDRRALDNAIFELQRAGGKGTLKSIMDDPRFREYFDAGGSLGDLAENIAPLSLLNLREAQGLGRGQLELSGRRLAPENPESTNKNLFDVMNPLAVEFFSRKGFSEGGKVKNPGTKLKNSKSCDCHD